MCRNWPYAPINNQPYLCGLPVLSLLARARAFFSNTRPDMYMNIANQFGQLTCGRVVLCLHAQYSVILYNLRTNLKRLTNRQSLHNVNSLFHKTLLFYQKNFIVFSTESYKIIYWVICLLQMGNVVGKQTSNEKSPGQRIKPKWVLKFFNGIFSSISVSAII